jgi:DNA primase
MPHISRSFISERLLPAVPIEKLIGSFIQLKKSGSNYVCCCPFHHEKTPSFTVTPSKNMFYCFGCKEHGDALAFLMKYHNLEFPDAVKELAEFANIPIEYDEGSSGGYEDRFGPMYELLDRCASAFTRELFAPEGREGLDYFMKKRGLTRDTILKCRLGYAPPGWHFLEEQVCRSEDEARMLAQLGMLVDHGGGRRFSMFRGRAMIPIFDRKGRVISFGGRTLGDDQPKYMNTKETPVFRKRNELFGLYEALKATNNRPQRLVVVEGYMDVISVRQAGIDGAVASLGTATTPDQFKQMFRYTKKVICCYDGDAAGRAAAWHALQTVTPVLTDDVEVRFAFLPDEEKVDPDSLVRTQGPGAFLKFLDEAQSYPDFLIAHSKAGHNLNDPGDRARFLSEVSSLIRAIPLKPLAEVCMQQLSEDQGISAARVEEMVGAATAPEEDPESPRGQASHGDPLLTTPMRKFVAFCLQHPMAVARANDTFKLDEFARLCDLLKIPGSDQARSLIESISAGGSGGGAPAAISTAVLLARQDDPRVRGYYDRLANADLGMESDGSMEQQLRWLARLLPEVLEKPFRDRAARLTASEESLSNAGLHESGVISRELDRRVRTKKD